MHRFRKIYLWIFVVSLIVFVVTLWVRQENIWKAAAVTATVTLAVGIGSIPALKSYQYTAWIITAVVAGMIYPAAFLRWGNFDLRNKWLILLVVLLVMFGMGIQMSLKDFSGIAPTGRGVLMKVEVITSSHLYSSADLLVISSDTRSMEKQQAVEEMSKITSLVKKMKPALIYKKVDSVMRGHIANELIAQLKVLNLPRALLIPANPVLGRTILDGIYFIHGQPEYFEKRFGSFARYYSSIAFVLRQFSGMGTVFSLLALALGNMIGDNTVILIVIIGAIINRFSIKIYCTAAGWRVTGERNSRHWR